MKKLAIGMHKALQLINLFHSSVIEEKQQILMRYQRKLQAKIIEF